MGTPLAAERWVSDGPETADYIVMKDLEACPRSAEQQYSIRLQTPKRAYLHWSSIKPDKPAGTARSFSSGAGKAETVRLQLRISAVGNYLR